MMVRHPASGCALCAARISRNPVFTITVLAMFSLGNHATTAVFSLVDPILFRSLPYAPADRMVSIGLAYSLQKLKFMMG
ncbi:MAG TPA: hypothetical protein VHT24_00360 [Pseudacidobacterium sp.]|jgi:hypothetical protein|nr:hypothetical protein [Pseudacidobacterium sp.]